MRSEEELAGEASMAQEKTIAATKAAHQNPWCAGIAANEPAKGTTAGTPSRQTGGEAPTGRKAVAVDAARRRVRQITVRPGETVGRAKISAAPAPPTIAARAAVSELPATKSATAAPAKAKKGAAGANRRMGCTDQNLNALQICLSSVTDLGFEYLIEFVAIDAMAKHSIAASTCLLLK